MSNKRFTPVRLREGYDMGEVDQFLDEVEAELARLNKENDDLRSKVAAAQSGDVVPAPAPAPVVAAGPRQIAPSAVRYQQLPSLNFPALSKRAREQGTVVLRITVDTTGRLKQALVHRSSGFERIDQAALRARPPREESP